MKSIIQNIKSGAKRGWAAPLIGVVASLAVAASAVLPAQVSAAEPEGPFLVLIGAPGSGKSTVAAYITESSGAPVIEVGQLLRDEVAAASKSTRAGKPGSQRAKANSQRLAKIEVAKNQLAAGELVDGQAIDAAVAARVLAPGAANGFILDGYPASVSQAEFLDALLAARRIAPIVIYLDVPDEVALARMKSRGRVDDKAGFGKKRLEVFRNNMAPLMNYYDGAGLFTVDASKDKAAVRAQVDKVLSVAHEISMY
jgi:adenylate kinase